MAPADWELPKARTPLLTQGELLLIDWVLCSASRLIPDADLGDLVSGWHEGVRLPVWRGIRKFSLPGTIEVQFPLDDTTAKALLAAVPTTFRWGTGEDVGFSLKQKLAIYLCPEDDVEYSHYQNRTQDPTESQSQPTAQPPASACASV